MESAALAILVAGAIIVLGVLLIKKSYKTGVSGIIPLLILGLIIGPLSKYFMPSRTPIFDPSSYTGPITALVTFVLVIVLFDCGYGIKISQLKKEAAPAIFLTLLTVSLTGLAASLISHFLIGLSWQLSLLLAALVMSTDLTIVAPLLKNTKISNYSREVLELESTLNSVPAAVIAIVAVSLLDLKDIGAREITQTFLYNIFVGAAIGLILGYLIVVAVKHLKLEDKPHIISVGAVLLVFAITELLGASGIIAALIVGMVFRNTGDLPSTIKSYSGDLEMLLIVFVYVLLGALLDFSALASVVIIAALFVGMVVLSRIGAAYLFRLKCKKPDFKSVAFSGPRGIVCAVLALSYAKYFPDSKVALALVFLTVLVTTIVSAIIPMQNREIAQPRKN